MARYGCIALIVALTACDRAPAPSSVAAGQAFPVTRLERLEGGHDVLADYRGKLVVLNVWATWCASCRRELPALQRLSATLDPARFAVLGLSADHDPLLVREYLLDQQVDFARHIDVNLQVAKTLLDIKVYPATFVVAPDGQLLATAVGPRAWDSAAIRTALVAAAQGRPFDLGPAVLPKNDD